MTKSLRVYFYNEVQEFRDEIVEESHPSSVAVILLCQVN